MPEPPLTSFQGAAQIDGVLVGATVDVLLPQLNALASIIESTSTRKQFLFGLRGAVGNIDFSSKISGVFSGGLTVDATVTGSANANELSGSSSSDTLTSGEADNTTGTTATTHSTAERATTQSKVTTIILLS